MLQGLDALVGNSQMLSTINRITNAFIIGNIDAVTAAAIFFNALILPKSRITRRARTSLTNQSGMSMPSGLRSIKDIITINTSR